MMIGGRLMTAVRALAAMYALMLVMRVDHRTRLLRRRELPNGCLLMIDSNNGVKV
jgi:hypothetical protein